MKNKKWVAWNTIARTLYAYMPIVYLIQRRVQKAISLALQIRLLYVKDLCLIHDSKVAAEIEISETAEFFYTV